MKNVVIHSEAELELWQAVDFYETRYTGLGLDFEKEVSRALSKIQENPERWSTKKHGARCCLLYRFPYIIYYIELQDVIWIVSIAHTRRKPYYWRSRIK
ncbi:MAG: type II toxin-antitoxin system RelE/ParE family toxin [bacterium]